MPLPDPSETSVAATVEGTNLTNLFSVINRDKVHGLNLTVPEDAKEVIKPWDQRDDNTRHVDSSVDDQLIIHVPFSENVRIRSILLKLGRGEAAPRKLSIYTNRPTIVDFNEAESSTPNISFSLLEETGVVEYPLKVAAFASIHSLSLFFNDSPSGEFSRIYYIGFRGDARSTKREVESFLHIPASNAADAPVTTRAENKAGGQTLAR